MTDSTLLGIPFQNYGHFGDFLQGVAGFLLLGGGLFALYQYRRGKQTDSIRWLTEMGSRFYQFDKIDEQLRREFEYEFHTKFAPAMEKWLVYPATLTEEEKTTLTQLDALLNFFELVCHVSAKDRHLGREDREATFKYWFDDVMRQGQDHVFLRLYLQFGFENLRDRVKFPAQGNYIAVYGSLMRAAHAYPIDAATHRHAAAARPRLGKYVGPCRIPGQLLNLGPYPGIVPHDRDSVVGELYELPFGELSSGELRQFRSDIRALDEFEGIDVHRPERSEYKRRFMKLLAPDDTAAWVYVHNRSSDAPIVPAGDWEAELERRAAAGPGPLPTRVELGPRDLTGLSGPRPL